MVVSFVFSPTPCTKDLCPSLFLTLGPQFPCL